MDHIPDDVMDLMANAMVQPGILKDGQALYPAGTKVRRGVLDRALEAACRVGWVMTRVGEAAPTPERALEVLRLMDALPPLAWNTDTMAGPTSFNPDGLYRKD